MLSEAAKSLALLNFQLIDCAGVGTPVRARALAVLALAKTTTHQPQEEAETLLSYGLGYTEHAKRIAEHLPPGHAIRLYVLRQDTNLSSMALSSGADGLAKFLLLQRLADLKNDKEWARTLKELFPDLDIGLPLLKTAIDLHEFDETRFFAPRISVAALAELSKLTGQNSELATILQKNRIEAFDTVLAGVKSEGLFADSELIKSYFTAYFYSGLCSQGLFYLDSLSSMESSIDFARKLGEPRSDFGKEFASWYLHLAESKLGKMKWEELRKDVFDLPHLGPNQVSRTMDEVGNASGPGIAEKVRCTRRFASMLDTRPTYRLLLARKMYSLLSDLKATNSLYASFVQCCKDYDQQAYVWYSKFTGNVHDLLTSTELDQNAKVDVFAYMIRSKDKTAQEIAEAYQQLIQLYPGNYYLTRNYADYLINSSKMAEGESLLKEWIEVHSRGEEGFEYIFARTRLAEIQKEQGRYDEAWAAVQPVISSYQGGAMIEAALVLDKMGKSEEALQMAKRVLERYPDDPGAFGLNLFLLWERGRDDKATELLTHYPFHFSQDQFCRSIGRHYAEVFASRPKEQGIHALSGLISIPAYRDNLSCFASRVDEAKNPGLAFAMMEFLIKQNIRSDYDLITAYGFKRGELGKEIALTWLRQAIPPNEQGAWVTAAMGMREYDLVWEIAPEIRKDNWAELTWLAQAAACAAVKCKDPKRAKLIEHYSHNNPGVNMLYCGRFLMEMISAKELQDFASNNSLMVQAAYYLGLKAETASDYDAASDWYRLAMETEQANQPYYPWAYDALLTWRDTGRNLDYIRKHPANR